MECPVHPVRPTGGTHVLTFALEHAYELGAHGHGHVGDETGGHLLGMAQQIVARPEEEVRQVAQEIDEAARCCRHVCYKQQQKTVKP